MRIGVILRLRSKPETVPGADETTVENLWWRGSLPDGVEVEVRHGERFVPLLLSLVHFLFSNAQALPVGHGGIVFFVVTSEGQPRPPDSA
jgi:hypothetical protein